MRDVNAGSVRRFHGPIVVVEQGEDLSYTLWPTLADLRMLRIPSGMA